MTGYGRSDLQNDEFILSLELKAINSRFLDFSPRLPWLLSPFEDEAYKLIKEKCIRGRITLSVKFDNISNEANSLVLNKKKLKSYLQIIKEIKKYSKSSQDPTLSDFLKLPDIIKSNLDSNLEIKNCFIKALKIALKEIVNSRKKEGRNIKRDMLISLKTITKLIKKVEKNTKIYKDENLNKYKKKIESLMLDYKSDINRIYQEVAIIAEKKDINEEIVRINSHLDLFNQYMNSNKSEGKKMNFLLQEMNREVNTIGSKTDILEVSHLVVQLKDELEKIREQVQNII